MTAPAAVLAEPEPAAPSESGSAERDPGARGALHIADRVVERVAAHAVSGVDSATGARRQLLGHSLGEADEDTRARVAAEVSGAVVTVSVSLSVSWPQSIRAVTDAVRRAVVDQVHHTTGLTVGHVDIDVPTLLTETTENRRVR